MGRSSFSQSGIQLSVFAFFFVWFFIGMEAAPDVVSGQLAVPILKEYIEIIDVIKSADLIKLNILLYRYKDQLTYGDLAFLEDVIDNEYTYHKTKSTFGATNLIMHGFLVILGWMLFTRKIVPPFLPDQKIESLIRLIPMAIGTTCSIELWRSWHRGEMIWGLSKKEAYEHHKKSLVFKRMKRVLRRIEKT